MKLFASICAGTVMAAGAATVPARAQVIQMVQARIIQVADVLRSDDGGYGRGAYAGPPEPVPMGDDSVILAPEEIPGILRQQGFSQLGPVFRRGWVYTVAVLNQNGDDGRLIVDARTGEPIRFIPAMRMDSRLRDELDRMYGPPGPPPARFARDPRDSYGAVPPRGEYPPRTASHDAPVASPHHAASLKRAAKTIAKTAPKPAPASVAAVPATPPAAPAAAQTAQLSGAAPKDMPKPEAKVEAKPTPAADTIELKPTEPMPPVQPMD
ncbi:hypothetical protein AFIC_000744 [[Pseudomonas] carboxydohydrogena]|uniref:PepSY domain-containing protein n=1 Tax=Afipia carboxydohydrogena TaxID=290 RepID=A0ABY8BTG3_AFICR|nr:hypothetical protein [[Pseudomonas] carboxydohydrogena]WEF52266.1 hypothetical protein AFIC_000744 [[Pseudomonas] carboxydohydrogena]